MKLFVDFSIYIIFYFAGTCPDPTPEHGFIANGKHQQLSNGRFPHGSKFVEISCNTSYVLDIGVSGDNIFFCWHGRWTPNPPAKCIPKDEGE